MNFLYGYLVCHKKSQFKIDSFFIVLKLNILYFLNMEQPTSLIKSIINQIIAGKIIFKSLISESVVIYKLGLDFFRSIIVRLLISSHQNKYLNS